MLILALDTTTRGGSVAVTRDAELLAVVPGDAARTHGERLPAEIECALAAAGVQAADLELIAVARGPGALTGLRIGLAAVQGLAMVLGVPVVGVSALDALAESIRRGPHARGRTIVCWMDAQRGEVFSAWYAADAPADAVPEPAASPAVGAPAEMLDGLPPAALAEAVFIGDGAARHRHVIESRTDGRAGVLDAPADLAAAVARVGRLQASRGEAGPPHALQPLYIRRSDAELARLQRSQR